MVMNSCRYSLEVIDIDAITKEEYEAQYECLDDRTKTAVSRKNPLKAKQTIAGRILLKKMVLERYGISDFSPQYNQNGKPLLPFCHFSITHTGNKVFCAVGDTNIGIDAQDIRQIKKAEHYPLFTKGETAVINSSSDTSHKFLEIWTRKEAYIKLMGYKLTDALDIDTTKDLSVRFETQEQDDVILTICY